MNEWNWLHVWTNSSSSDKIDDCCRFYLNRSCKVERIELRNRCKFDWLIEQHCVELIARFDRSGWIRMNKNRCNWMNSTWLNACARRMGWWQCLWSMLDDWMIDSWLRTESIRWSVPMIRHNDDTLIRSVRVGGNECMTRRRISVEQFNRFNDTLIDEPN